MQYIFINFFGMGWESRGPISENYQGVEVGWLCSWPGYVPYSWRNRVRGSHDLVGYVCSGPTGYFSLFLL